MDGAALRKRYQQGWLMEVTNSLDHCIERLRYNSWPGLFYVGSLVDTDSVWEPGPGRPRGTGALPCVVSPGFSVGGHGAALGAVLLCRPEPPVGSSPGHGGCSQTHPRALGLT